MGWWFRRRSPEQEMEDYYKRIAYETARRAVDSARWGDVSFGFDLADQSGLSHSAAPARQEVLPLSAEMQEWAARLPLTCYSFQSSEGVFFFQVERVDELGQVVCRYWPCSAPGPDPSWPPYVCRISAFVAAVTAGYFQPA